MIILLSFQLWDIHVITTAYIQRNTYILQTKLLAKVSIVLLISCSVMVTQLGTAELKGCKQPLHRIALRNWLTWWCCWGSLTCLWFRLTERILSLFDSLDNLVKLLLECAILVPSLLIPIICILLLLSLVLRTKPCHILPHIFFGFEFDVFIDLQILWMAAVFQLFIKDCVCKLQVTGYLHRIMSGREGKIKRIWTLMQRLVHLDNISENLTKEL